MSRKKLYNVCQFENKTGLKIVLNTFENFNDALERTCYLNINNRSNSVSYITEEQTKCQEKQTNF
jgi:hypothetical protein